MDFQAFLKEKERKTEREEKKERERKKEREKERSREREGKKGRKGKRKREKYREKAGWSFNINELFSDRCPRIDISCDGSIDSTECNLRT